MYNFTRCILRYIHAKYSFSLINDLCSTVNEKIELNICKKNKFCVSQYLHVAHIYNRSTQITTIIHDNFISNKILKLDFSLNCIDVKKYETKCRLSTYCTMHDGRSFVYFIILNKLLFKQ